MCIYLCLPFTAILNVAHVFAKANQSHPPEFVASVVIWHVRKGKMRSSALASQFGQDSHKCLEVYRTFVNIDILLKWVLGC
jgi:hypothetical protein